MNQQTQKSSAPSTEQILPRSRSGALRILVVDDQPDWCDLLATFLRLKGHSVRDATSGSDAMRICFEFSPDIVFVDIRMPDMDGSFVPAHICGTHRGCCCIWPSGTMARRRR